MISVNKSNSYQLHGELEDVWRIHPWTRSTLSTIGRSLMGQMFEIIPRRGMQGEASPEERQKCWEYFYPTEKAWENVKDFISTPAKIYLTAVYLKLFGQAAWEQIRNGFGKLSGFDMVFGKIMPNIDIDGTFKNPAWTQYAKGGSQEFESPRDIVYFVLPDIEGYMTGSSDLEALTSTTLTTDLLAGLANQSLLENMGSPDGIFAVDKEIGDDLWEEAKAQIRELYSGPINFGRPMLASRGLVDFKPFTQPRDMQWGESRGFNREEISAATGVYTGIMGLMEGLSRANLTAVRRQFWATTNKPLCALIENSIEEQIFQREFQVYDWVLRFLTPEFQTEQEEVYNAIRRVTHGISTPNYEAAQMGIPIFEGGDIRLVPANMRILGEEPPSPGGDEAWGTHPMQGRPVGVDTAEPAKGEFAEQRDELRNWLRICRAMANDGEFPVTKRIFQPRELPPEYVEWGHERLSQARTLSEVEEVFDGLFSLYR